MVLYFWMMVQIIGESLPISSSGHVLLLQRIIEKYGSNSMPLQDLWAFDYFLQGISAIIIFCYFFSTWWQLVIKKPLQISALFDVQVWKKNIFPVIVFGFVTDAVTFLFWALHVADCVPIHLALGFMITGVVLWSMQFARENKALSMWDCKHALLLGAVQGCALFPGVSRFATTVAALQWLGYSPVLAFAISFLVQWPLIIAGSLLGILSLHDASILHGMCSISFIVTTACAAVCGYVALHLVGKIIDKNKLWKFSYYMVVPTIIALFI